MTPSGVETRWVYSLSHQWECVNGKGRKLQMPRRGEYIWWSWPGLNRRPRECHSRALPTAPQPHVTLRQLSRNCCILVGHKAHNLYEFDAIMRCQLGQEGERCEGTVSKFSERQSHRTNSMNHHEGRGLFKKARPARLQGLWRPERTRST